jgi:hypothetical protein
MGTLRILERERHFNEFRLHGESPGFRADWSNVGTKTRGPEFEPVVFESLSSRN